MVDLLVLIDRDEGSKRKLQFRKLASPWTGTVSSRKPFHSTTRWHAMWRRVRARARTAPWHLEVTLWTWRIDRFWLTPASFASK